MMRQRYPNVSLACLCGLFGVTRQAYYDAENHEKKTSIANMVVLCLVKEIRALMPLLGTRKLVNELEVSLQEHGIKMGRDKLFDLLALHGMLIRRRRRLVKTTDSHHWLKKYPNLTSGLVIDASELLWVADITYIRTLEGFNYLSLITDAYSRKIVGYALHPNLEAIGCIEALKMAIAALKKKDIRLIHHSDRGIQYCSAAYVDILMNNDIEISMTQNGSPYEDALAERMNGIIKTEFLSTTVPTNHKAAKKAINRSIETYNQRRPHSSLDFLTPEKAHELTGTISKRWKSYNKKAIKQKEGLVNDGFEKHKVLL
jgi:putative transposase